MYRRIRMLLLLLIFCVVGDCASVCGEIVSVAEPVSTEPILISEQIEMPIKEEEHSGIPAAVEVKELLDNGEEAGLSEEDIDLIALVVKEELLARQNYEVIFFTAGGYSKYGTPMFQEGNHYFSSYE